jgi:hypothetical protein
LCLHKFLTFKFVSLGPSKIVIHGKFQFYPVHVKQIIVGLF